MDRSHYTVLAQVSLSYSVPEGRFPRVTHPCATRPEGLVRLACVRHAASVRSEPESNSQVDVRSSLRRNMRKQDRHLREPFLHKITNGVFAIGTLERLSFFRSNRYPEVIGDRAAAHMSLHLNRQCQRADALPPPVRLVPGIGLYRPRRGAKRTRDLLRGRVRLLEAAYMCGLPMRQPAFLQNCCNRPLPPLRTPFRPLTEV